MNVNNKTNIFIGIFYSILTQSILLCELILLCLYAQFYML
jgi:hypothetical protein